jgi:hypothetical protein|tara:strand:+ start:857 stop:1099 length:243 start_codon:yes stop_codon:yes gene_type:complete
MTWKDEIKKNIPEKPITVLNKVKHYVDGIIYIMSEEKEGKMVVNRHGKHTEYVDARPLAKAAINLLEKFTDIEALYELYE